MRVPQPLLAGILGMKLPSFPTKGQLVESLGIVLVSMFWEFTLVASEESQPIGVLEEIHSPSSVWYKSLIHS